jgi:twitching motility protein PilT
LTAAETGHLVFATLHTQSAPSTIDRIIDVFPAAQQDQVRMQLANTLQGIVTQTLLPKADGSGRVCALEVLFLDDAIRNLIRQGKIEQVYSYMQTGTRRGMQTMEQSLLELVQKRLVTVIEALGRSSRPEALVSAFERASIPVPTMSNDGPPNAPITAALRVAGS